MGTTLATDAILMLGGCRLFLFWAAQFTTRSRHGIVGSFPRCSVGIFGSVGCHGVYGIGSPVHAIPVGTTNAIGTTLSLSLVDALFTQ